MTTLSFPDVQDETQSFRIQELRRQTKRVITLHGISNMRTYFMKKVAGMRCNYRVTCDDRAWNTFLKKVGPYIEFGEFHSAKARPDPRLHGAARKKRRQQKTMFKRTARSATMTTVAHMTSSEKPSFEQMINLAFERIAAECEHQRQALIGQIEKN